VFIKRVYVFIQRVQINRKYHKYVFIKRVYVFIYRVQNTFLRLIGLSAIAAFSDYFCQAAATIPGVLKKGGKSVFLLILTASENIKTRVYKTAWQASFVVC
jgi:hypothetical protein